VAVAERLEQVVHPAPPVLNHFLSHGFCQRLIAGKLRVPQERLAPVERQVLLDHREALARMGRQE
jgi:hypothetical protein